MIAIVNLIEQSKMINEQNRPIEIVPVEPNYPDLNHSKHLDSTHSIDILVIFTLLTGINKLRKSIDKLRKQGRLDSKLLLQIVGAILAIWKAIVRIMAEQDDEG
jgi:hypothetical protein